MIEERFGKFLLVTIDETPLLKLNGELDISNVADLQQAFEAVPASEQIVIDMAEVEFLDSTALAALVRYRNGAVARGSAIVLVIANPLVQRIFDITNFNREFTIVRRLEDVPGLFPRA